MLGASIRKVGSLWMVRVVALGCEIFQSCDSWKEAVDATWDIISTTRRREALRDKWLNRDPRDTVKLERRKPYVGPR